MNGIYWLEFFCKIPDVIAKVGTGEGGKAVSMMDSEMSQKAGVVASTRRKKEDYCGIDLFYEA